MLELLELLLDCGLLELLDCTENDEELLSAVDELLSTVDELLSSAEELLDCSVDDEVVVLDELLDCAEVDEELLKTSEEVLVELLDCTEEELESSPHAVKVRTTAAAVTALKIFLLIFIPFFRSFLK